jgi:deoxyadenosine/deoxycytidine kinase
MTASAPFIVVTGNIAAGKSTLVQRLAAELGLAAHPERIQENPFFGSPQHRALESEMWFLADSVAIHRTIQREGRGGVQERSAYDHIPVFARARARCGWLGADELQLLEQLAQLLYEGLRPPDLLVYAEADLAAIAARITARGRPGEQLIDSGYLSLLAELYDELIDGWRLSRVYRLDTTRVDVRHDEGFRLASHEILELLP